MPAKYPLLMLPEPIEHQKSKRVGFRNKVHRPDTETQKKRLAPQFMRIQDALKKKKIGIQFSPRGIDPELALVFDVAESLSSFYGSVSKIDGLEWLFDLEDKNMAPDEYFYYEQNANDTIDGHVYCVMSNKSALDQILSLWHHYIEEENYVFPRGYTSLRDLFHLLRDVHIWGPNDRFEDTGIMEYWRETIEVKGHSRSRFEAELFYRSDEDKRDCASANVRKAVELMDGSVISECVIEEIGYHGLLLELPANQIESFFGSEWDKLSLAVCDEVMYYRPVGQIAADSLGEIFEKDITDKLDTPNPTGMPIVGMLDGLPLENHAALHGRVIVDDPDGFGEDCPVGSRYHGTAMASILIHGDLAANDISTLNRPIYVRPILRPDRAFGLKETYPEDRLIVDLVHRCVKRIFDGEANEPSVAASLRVINLSIGDEARQFFGVPSSLAKLLDWLSYKYRVLFVVSAGNQHIEHFSIKGGFDGLKEKSLDARSLLFGQLAISEKRNLRLLSPAESMNSLTVGATYEDNASIEESDLALQPVEEGDVSPINSYGAGIGRSIKPEILFPGGKFLVSLSSEADSVKPVAVNSREPGVIVAAPSSGSIVKSYSAEFGTSCSAAEVSHECALNYDVLEEVFINSGLEGVPRGYASLLLKAMAVHGCTYESMGAVAERQFEANKREMTKWVGFGCPDYARVRECAFNRVTAFGYGDIGKDEGQLFHIPLPLDLSSRVLDRRLTVTMAYFTPVAHDRQEYRRAQLWFDRSGITKERLVPDREYTDYQAIRRGTLQHQSFIGKGSLPWDESADGIDILVSCATTSNLPSLQKAKIPYALIITFETKQPIEVYQPVAERLRTPITVR